MIKIEKSFEREVLVAIVDMANGQSVIGFDTHTPHMHFRRIPYGKFGVRIKTPEPTDVVIRLDNVVIAHKRLDPGDQTLSCSPDGKPFVFAAAGTRITPAPAEQVAAPVESPAAEPATTPDFLAPLPLAPSHGLVVVSVRFADVKPTTGPELPPDDFSHVIYQMNEPRAHMRAVAANLQNMIGPDRIPDTGEFVGPAGSQPAATPLPRRTCCCAPDRE